MQLDLRYFMPNVPKIDLTPTIPKEEFEERVSRVRAMLADRSLDVGVAYGNELKPGDVGWLTGYDPHLEEAACVVGPNALFVLGGPEGCAYATEQMKVGEFRNLEALKIPEEDYPGVMFSSMAQILGEACGREVKRIGVLTTESIVPIGMQRLLEQQDGADIVDASDFLLRARYTKSENEQCIMAAAAEICTHAMHAMINAVEPGLRETEVAAVGDFMMRALGADGRPGVSTLVDSGLRASNVIGRASNKVIKRGDIVLLGLSARLSGLSSSLSRTIVAGGESPHQRQLLDRIAQAHEAAVAELAFGRPARGPDLAARRELAPVCLAPMYSVVHNIGWTEAMEGYGAATQYSDYEFPKNVTLMVDVGVFGSAFKSLPADTVGVRIEDPFLIDDDGVTRRLTDLPLRL